MEEENWSWGVMPTVLAIVFEAKAASEVKMMTDTPYIMLGYSWCLETLTEKH